MGLKRLLLLLTGNIHCRSAIAYTHSNTNTYACSNTNTDPNSIGYAYANSHSYSKPNTRAFSHTVRNHGCEPHHLYAARKPQF